jgi:hypothetical protein
MPVNKNEIIKGLTELDKYHCISINDGKINQVEYININFSF